MAKKETVQMRVHVNHKETMQDWADRLGLSLTQLYLVLTCQAGEHDLNRLVLTEFACKQLQRIGLPTESPMIIQAEPDATKHLTMLLAFAARLEFAEAVGDHITAETMRDQVAQSESNLLRAYGAAVPKPHQVTDNN